MKISQSFRVLTLAACVAGTVPVLQAQTNIVANGSFETGDFTSWNTTAAEAGSWFGVDTSGNPGFLTAPDGNSYAYFAATSGHNDSIDQVLSTTPGATYDVNFWVNDSGSANFTATWGGTVLTQLVPSNNTGSANFGWADFDFTVTATSATTDLAFAASSGAVLGLDNVVVTANPVPEPTSLNLLAFFGGALVMAGYVNRRRQKA